ncbi:ComF family protein [Leifsonia sp. NPDC058248]|uniref:ComF family protein n=1 Tax=Leifsonia sp. NPDC058248 TaxID=3346402 RepID=UPI0036DDAA08
MTTADTLRPLLIPLREAVLDALSVVSPISCSGCGADDRSLCADCRRALAPAPARLDDGVESPPVWASLAYAGSVRAVLLAFKDHGRTDAGPALARALRASVVAAIAGARPVERAGGVTLVTVPSTRAAFRSRGYHPTELMLRRAGLSIGSRSLRLSRQVADQAGLSAAGRAQNRSGSFAASQRLAGRACLIVDDIVTSGATIREANRAIEAAGGRVIGAAALAHTELRGSPGR